MDIAVQAADYSDIESMREGFREEADCQIVTDSILRRGLADPYLILVDGHTAGYGGVWNEHYPGRVMEFHTTPNTRLYAQSMFKELLAVSGATHIEAQTNLPLILNALYDFAEKIVEEKILFQDAFTSELSFPETVFRPVAPDDEGRHTPT